MKPRRITHAERTKAEILAVAVPLAARIGLEGLTIGRLADEMGMSKGGVFAHFGSKEGLQVATVEAAFQAFADEVLTPAMAAPEGIARLRALLSGYLDYVEKRKDAGGCFFTAASLEFDDRPGEVRERISGLLAARTELIVEELRKAVARGELQGDPEDIAFEATAISTGANVQFQLSKDPSVLARARALLEARLAAHELKPSKRRAR